MGKLLDLSIDNVRRYNNLSANGLKQYRLWAEIFQNENILDGSHFSDGDFVDCFLRVVPNESEQLKYVENTCNYVSGKRSYNPDYVLVSRRSVLGDKPKPEAFWTTQHSVAYCGLRKEIPEPVRYFTSIMISTLGKLEKHGLSETNGGSSDGEVVIDRTKPFSDFLFIYQLPQDKEKMDRYIKNGGKSKQQILKHYADTVASRSRAQGFEL